VGHRRHRSRRSRQYLVEGVDLPPQPPGDSTLVRLSCLEDDAQGEPLEVLWEREIDARLLRETDWNRIASRGFDEPRLFSAYLHTLRWNCVTATDPKLFQAPYRAGIEVKAYQLEPLRMALRMPRVNLFIADDVGLGKTIEAGLIVRELLMRQKVRRVVICVPPSVVRQWRDEMEERFGLTFVIYDRDYVPGPPGARLRGQPLEDAHALHPLARPPARRGLRRPAARLARRVRRGSMLILDEAHNAAPPAAASTRSTPSSPARCATSRPASSTSCSCPRRRTTATATASPPCSSCSTPSASSAACPSTPSCATP
jgi:hypothetical protein